MSNSYGFSSLPSLGQRRDKRKAFGRKNRPYLFPGPEPAVPHLTEDPKSDPKHPSCKYRCDRYLQWFRRSCSFEHGRCRSLPRLGDRKRLLLNGDGVLLKEIVVKLAVALRSSRKTE